MHKKFQINWTKIRGSCQSGRKVVPHNSKSDLPLTVQCFLNVQFLNIYEFLYQCAPLHSSRRCNLSSIPLRASRSMMNLLCLGTSNQQGPEMTKRRLKRLIVSSILTDHTYYLTKCVRLTVLRHRQNNQNKSMSYKFQLVHT